MLSGTHFGQIAGRHGLYLERGSVHIDDFGADFHRGRGRDRAGRDWILRVPRCPEALGTARNEARALQLLRGHLATPVPDWQIFRPDLVAYPRLPGTPVASRERRGGREHWRWAEKPRRLSAEFRAELSAALTALGRLTPPGAEDASLPVESAPVLRRRLADHIANCRTFVEIHPAWLARWEAWLSDDSYWQATTCLVHGNLEPDELLSDDEGRLTGILDWSHARYADPVIDLAALYRHFGWELIDDLLARAPGTEAFGPRVREHLVEWDSLDCLILAQRAALAGNNRGLEEARANLSRPPEAPLRASA